MSQLKEVKQNFFLGVLIDDKLMWNVNFQSVVWLCTKLISYLTDVECIFYIILSFRLTLCNIVLKYGEIHLQQT